MHEACSCRVGGTGDQPPNIKRVAVCNDTFKSYNARKSIGTGPCRMCTTKPDKTPLLCILSRGSRRVVLRCTHVCTCTREVARFCQADVVLY